MKILITGNPEFQGLCHGLQEVLSMYELKFISRGTGYDLYDFENVSEMAKDYDVFINSTNIPDDGQLKMLDMVYSKWSMGHIINVSTTSVYWNNQTKIKYYEQKLKLEQRSKELSNQSAEFGNDIRISCIAYGQLDTPEQRKHYDGRKKMSVITAANYIKMLIESPKDINIHYICLDPRQTDS